MNTLSAPRIHLRNNPSRQRGIGLIELAIAAAISIGIIVLALQVVPELRASGRADSEVKLLPKISANIQRLYSSQPAYPVTANAIVTEGIKFNVYPKEYIESPTALRNRWGGAITVTATANQATIRYADVPNLECAEIATALSGSFRDLRVLNQATVGTAVAPAATDTMKNAQGRLDIAKMGTPGTAGRCTSVADVNTIDFIISK